MEIFTKSFTQQEPIDEASIGQVSDILRSGRLHRYNTAEGAPSEAALLEQEFAQWQESAYCIAVTSGGQAMQIALRAAGVAPGDVVLSSAYTLAPVPGALHAVGAVPALIETTKSWHIDPDHLAQEAERTGARFLLLSLMRGHIPDMGRIQKICAEKGILMIEDCAHTMGAKWRGTRSGNFGKIACFSTQTYKHINSGEGGLITTDDPEIAARAVVLSGSYMLYSSHGARPEEEVFRRVRLDVPNCSARLDNLRAALIRAQLPRLDAQIARWNTLYRVLETELGDIPGLYLPARAQEEAFVGSSIQFHGDMPDPQAFLAAAAERGIVVKWFGAGEPDAFTSRFDSWAYLGAAPDLPRTLKVLSTTYDMRIPLTFEREDCEQIARILGDVIARL